MKIGLISDIHADLSSLKKALTILDREQVDQIICAGDLVEDGKDGDAVVKLIRERKIPCVLGNHDEMAHSNQQWIIENLDESHPKRQHMLLTDETIDYVKNLPRQLRFEWEGSRILLVHGTPASNLEYLWAKSPRAKIREHGRNAKAHIILYGHTHQPAFFSLGFTKFINPGSVKKGEFLSSNTCAILTLPECKVDLYFLKTGLKLEQVAQILS